MITTNLTRGKEHVLEVVEETARRVSNSVDGHLREAISAVAQKNGVDYSTIESQCTRELGGIGIDAFSAGVKNEICGACASNHIKEQLLAGEPQDVQLEIMDRLGRAKVSSTIIVM